VKRKVQKVRTGFQIVIPKQFADMVGITSGIEMEMRYQNNELVMTPVAVVRQDQTATEAGTTTTEGDCNG